MGQELEVAMELIGEVFLVEEGEVRRMIKERMERKGMIRDRRKDQPENVQEDSKKEPKATAIKAKSPSRKRKVD